LRAWIHTPSAHTPRCAEALALGTFNSLPQPFYHWSTGDVYD